MFLRKRSSGIYKQSLCNGFVADGDIIVVLGLDTQLCAATKCYVVHPEVRCNSRINPSSCGASDGVANIVTSGGVPAVIYGLMVKRLRMLLI